VTSFTLVNILDSFLGLPTPPVLDCLRYGRRFEKSVVCGADGIASLNSDQELEVLERNGARVDLVVTFLRLWDTEIK